ncbi:MAG: hypothetical protein ABI666_08790 [Ferruginibacter sp.]
MAEHDVVGTLNYLYALHTRQRRQWASGEYLQRLGNPDRYKV